MSICVISDIHGCYQNPDFLATMAGYRSQHHYNIWTREDALAPGGKENATIIFGHTPTILKDSFFIMVGEYSAISIQIIIADFII